VSTLAQKVSHVPDYIRQSPKSLKSPKDSTFEGSASRRLLVVVLPLVGPAVWNSKDRLLAIILRACRPAEDGSVSAVFGAPSALEALCDNAPLRTLTLSH